jgi:hypothetical protein
VVPSRQYESALKAIRNCFEVPSLVKKE